MILTELSNFEKILWSSLTVLLNGKASNYQYNHGTIQKFGELMSKILVIKSVSRTGQEGQGGSKIVHKVPGGSKLFNSSQICLKVK